MTRRWACRWHLLDAVVVVASLALELSLHNLAQEVASLLIFFRCAGPSETHTLGCSALEGVGALLWS